MELTILTKLGIAPRLSEAHLERIFERQESRELIWHYDLDYREKTAHAIKNLSTKELDLRARALENITIKDPTYLRTDEFVERLKLYRQVADGRLAKEEGYKLIKK
jgi:hypothetical protein